MSADFNGRTITPGVTVVYPTRRGSAMWLSSGQVREVVGDKVKVVVTTETDGKRVVYIPAVRCVVQSDTEVRNALRVGVLAATKFIGKVDRGEARSVETYRELTEFKAEAAKLGVVA